MSSASSVSSPTDSCLAQDQQPYSGNLLHPEIFPGIEVPPAIVPGLKVPTILGNGALIKFASGGGDVNKVFQFFSDQVRQFPQDASLKLDLALLHLIRQQREEAYCLQAQALEWQQLFRVVGTKGAEVPTRRRVLALVAPGDFMNNAQLEFLLDGSDIRGAENPSPPVGRFREAGCPWRYWPRP